MTVAARITNISKKFGESIVLENINFEVAEGEIVVLLGATGSGKTTILRIIVGLETADSGKIVLHEKDVSELPAGERGVGVIFQAYALFPQMSVEKNVSYGLRLRKKSKAEIKQRVDELIELVGLEENRKKYPSQLYRRAAAARRHRPRARLQSRNPVV